MKLPAEIRNQIYRLNLLQEPYVLLQPPDCINWWRLLRAEYTRSMETEAININLLITSRRIYEEASRIFYLENRFIFAIDSSPRFTRIPRPMIDYLSEVTVIWWGGGAASLFKNLSFLRELKILHIRILADTWSCKVSKSVASYEWLSEDAPAEARELFDVHGIHELLTIRGLESVDIEPCIAGPTLQAQARTIERLLKSFLCSPRATETR